MILYIFIFIAFVAFGIFVANNAQSEFMKVYKEYKKINIEEYVTVQDFLNKLYNTRKFSSVRYVLIDKELNDSYYYKNNTVYLSKTTASGFNIASFAIIAHEMGHAEQNLDGSKMYNFSLFLRKLSRWIGWLAMPLTIIGAVLAFVTSSEESALGWIVLGIGILLFAIMVLSSLVITIIEFNASKRAINLLRQHKIMDESELKKAKRFLRHAGYTYLGNFFSFLFSWTFLVPKPKVL